MTNRIEEGKSLLKEYKKLHPFKKLMFLLFIPLLLIQAFWVLGVYPGEVGWIGFLRGLLFGNIPNILGLLALVFCKTQTL